MKWHFQPSPHDTHDWDAIQTTVLFDGSIDGQPRKLLAQASRNGYFFVLDRTNGKNVVTSEFVKTNWAKGIDPKGQPIPNTAKEPQLDGALVSPNQGGAANWPPPSFSPATGLFYVNASRAFSIHYIFDTDEKPEGWGGNDRGGWSESMLQAVDYKTGKIRWSHKWEGAGGRSGVLAPRATWCSRETRQITLWGLTQPRANRCGTLISAMVSATAPLVMSLTEHST